MTITFIAIDPAGRTHKRTSKSRIYGWTVVANRSYAFDAHQASNPCAALIRTRASNYAYHSGMAKDGQYESRGVMLKVRSEDERAKHAAQVAGIENVAQYLAREQRKDEEVIATRVASGYYVGWVNLGWQSRRDLADKLAASSRASGFYADVKVLEAACR